MEAAQMATANLLRLIIPEPLEIGGSAGDPLFP